jgi:hypothetical protein
MFFKWYKHIINPRFLYLSFVIRTRYPGISFVYTLKMKSVFFKRGVVLGYYPGSAPVSPSPAVVFTATGRYFVPGIFEAGLREVPMISRVRKYRYILSPSWYGHHAGRGAIMTKNPDTMAQSLPFTKKILAPQPRYQPEKSRRTSVGTIRENGLFPGGER